MPTTITPDTEETTCFYCASADCFCECTLLWEIHHKVGRGREGFDYTTTEAYQRLVDRGLI